MPKILLGISNSFCANFLKGQVNFLVQHGFEVVIISGPGEEISMLAKKEKANLHIINFTRRFSVFYDLICLWRIIKILKQEKPDIVNAGNPKSGFLIMLACKIVGIKNRIFTLHGLLSDTKKGMARWIITSAEKISCSIAKKVWVVSPSLKQHAVARKILQENKAIVFGKGCFNGIQLEEFNRSPEVMADADKLKQKLQLTNNDFVIGFAGRLAKDKGIDLLLNAFDTIHKKYAHVKLVLAGPIEKDDPISEHAQEEININPHIFYLGKMHNMPSVYPLFDILVVASYREGFGNVLIEAAAMNVAVIAPEIPGCKDAVQKNENGLLFAKGNLAELTTAIENYILHPEMKKQHAAAGRAFVQKNFSSQSIWQHQLHFYHSILASSFSKAAMVPVSASPIQ